MEGVLLLYTAGGVILCGRKGRVAFAFIAQLEIM